MWGSRCMHCKVWAYWKDGALKVPAAILAPARHPDMPPTCVEDYDEAREVAAVSPRAAAALLRLVVQKMLLHLGEKGRSIDDDIGSLFAKGLSVEVQQALDVCRVVGNNAVHPGALDLRDDQGLAHQLFMLVNFIVDDRIAKPRQIRELFGALPQGARSAIEKRDASDS